ncbi:MAG TPA: DoxX family protein [Terriglobales bacterium]|nr:DoxX family protein [Terriglobales bacterium]
MRYLDRLQPLGLLALRLVLGIIMIAHGYTKLTPPGFHQHANFVGHLEMPWWFAFFSTAAENLGGTLLILGLFTRFVSLAIFAELLVIITKVHWKNGLLAEHGYQFPLALAAIAFALIFLGAGAMSFDALRGSGGGAVRKKS